MQPSHGMCVLCVSYSFVQLNSTIMSNVSGKTTDILDTTCAASCRRFK